MIEPDPKEIVLCVVGSSLAAFAASWVVRKVFREKSIPVEFVAFADGNTYGADGRNAIEIDVPTGTANGARSLIRFESAGTAVPLHARPLPVKNWEAVFPYGVKTFAPEGHRNTSVIQSNTSVAGAAWDFFHAHEFTAKRPFVIDQINDRAAGNNLFRDSADTYACVDSYPRDFVTFDRIVEAGADRRRREFLINGGQAINRAFAKYAGQAIRVEAEK